MQRLLIFASGNGSTAQAILDYLKPNPQIEVIAIACPNPKAFVVQRAIKSNVSTLIFSRDEFLNDTSFKNRILDYNLDLIVLAGFMWLVPQWLIDLFPNRMLNIHPALLPKFGGKGMFGDKVHQAVLDSKEAMSGTTIHLVNERYDEGQILCSFFCPVPPERSLESLRHSVQALEKYWYPRVIEWYASQVSTLA